MVANGLARRRAGAARFRDLSTDTTTRRRPDRAPLDSSRATGADHLPRQDAPALGARESAAQDRIDGRSSPRGAPRLLSKLHRLSWRSPGWAGTFRSWLQPGAGELLRQWHNRPAHRELRLLARRKGRSWPASRRNSLELGDAGVGELFD